MFFIQIYKTKASNDYGFEENRIFKEVENDFKKLKLLFEDENWYSVIPEETLKNCLQVFKQEKQKIEDELKKLIKIFNIKNFDKFKLNTLEKDIFIYIRKEEIFYTVYGCINLIDELDGKQTDFYKELNNIKKSFQNNISLNEIETFGKTLEKFGLNVLNPKDEDKNYLNILCCIHDKKGMIELIFNLSNRDIDEFQKIIEEPFNIFFINYGINSMIECSNMIHIIKQNKEKNSDKELIQIFIKIHLKIFP